MKRIVSLGGGTMHSRVAAGIVLSLRDMGYSTGDIDAMYTAFVTSTDRGGSTGQLISEYEEKGVCIPGFGDLRNVLGGVLEFVGKDELAALISYRDGEGHCNGNKILADAYMQHGGSDFMSSIKKLRGYPGNYHLMTPTPCDLVVNLSDGVQLLGDEGGDDSIESRGARHPGVVIDPASMELVARGGEQLDTTRIVGALQSADVVILCGGRPYTSIMPSLLLPGVCDAICSNTHATICMFTNASTWYNQSHGWIHRFHVDYFSRLLGRKPDTVIVNTSKPADYAIEDMEQNNNSYIPYDAASLSDLSVIATDLLSDVVRMNNARKGHLVLHDPEKLSSLFKNIFIGSLGMQTFSHTIVLTTGGFDPVHIGHIKLFQEAAQIGKLIVGLNSDEWLIKKRGKPFMTRHERRKILLEMQSVSDVIAFDDMDECGSATDAIKKIHGFYAGSGAKIVFAKGGDRTADNIPEAAICEELGVEIVYGVGGYDKPQSSSRLLDNWYSFAKSTGRTTAKDKQFNNANYGG